MIPTVLVHLGITVGESFVPLYARNLGASLAQAAFFSAMLFVGQAAVDLPGGMLVLRMGERKAMLIGGGIMSAAMLLRITAVSPAPFIASIILSGAAASLIWLARMSWLKKEIRGNQRGYIMSFVGGSLRIALILGPLIGGFIAEGFGYRALFTVQAALQLLALAVVGASMPKTPVSGEGYHRSLTIARAAWRKNRRSIFAAAVGIGGLSVLRSSRAVLFPLWGAEIGLGEGRIGIVMFVWSRRGHRAVLALGNNYDASGPQDRGGRLHRISGFGRGPASDGGHFYYADCSLAACRTWKRNGGGH